CGLRRAPEHVLPLGDSCAFHTLPRKRGLSHFPKFSQLTVPLVTNRISDLRLFSGTTSDQREVDTVPRGTIQLEVGPQHDGSRNCNCKPEGWRRQNDNRNQSGSVDGRCGYADPSY